MAGEKLEIKLFETCVGFLSADIQKALPGATVESKMTFLQRKFSTANCAINVRIDSNFERIKLVGSVEQIIASHHLLYAHIHTDDISSSNVGIYGLYFDKAFSEVANKQVVYKIKDNESHSFCQIGNQVRNESTAASDMNDENNEGSNFVYLESDSENSDTVCLQEVNSVVEQEVENCKNDFTRKLSFQATDNIETRVTTNTSNILQREVSSAVTQTLYNQPLRTIICKLKLPLNTRSKYDNKDTTLCENNSMSLVAKERVRPEASLSYCLDDLKKMSKYFYLSFNLKRKSQTCGDVVRIVVLANRMSGIMSNKWLFKCSRCKLYADNIVILDQHMIVEHSDSDANGFKAEADVCDESRSFSDESPFSCSAAECNKTFVNLDDIQNHIREHICSQSVVQHSSVLVAVFCPRESCNKSFTSILSVLDHMKDSHDDMESKGCILCRCCGKVCFGIEDFQQHVGAWHSITINSKLVYCCAVIKQCSTCLLYANLSQAAAHTARHHSGKLIPVICETCGKSFPQHSILQQHTKIHLKVETTELCERCGKQFSCKNSLQLHMQATHKDVSCSLPLSKWSSFVSGSDTRYDSKVPLRMQEQCTMRKQRRPYDTVLCTVCGKQCRGNVGLIRHKMWMHNGTRSAEARHSKSSVVRRGRLSRVGWAARKKNVDVVVCSMCKQKFAAVAELRRHQSLSHGANAGKVTAEEFRKAFYCWVCYKRFTSQAELSQHEHFIHQLDKVYCKPTLCETCGREFDSKLELDKHSALMHTASSAHSLHGHTTLTYECSICGMGFIHKKSVRSHENLHWRE